MSKGTYDVMSYQPLGLMASEKIFEWLSHCKYMRANVPWVGSILNRRGITGRNCKTSYEPPCGKTNNVVSEQV